VSQVTQILTYCIDLDGTLCSNTLGAYESAIPIPEAILHSNALFKSGHRVKIFTARGSSTGKDWKSITETQLETWGVEYHELIFGKPEADVYIDDKGQNAFDWYQEMNANESDFTYVHKSLLEAHVVALQNTKSAKLLLDACKVVTESLRNGNKILWCGNGGSASDSQHLAAELVGRFAFNRPALASIALTTDSSILTAVGNDFGFETIFSRQVAAIGKTGDVLVGITTSGSSPNVLLAVETAKQMGMTTLAFTGEKLSPLDEMADICLKAPSLTTAHIQESHITWGQIICGYAEKTMFKN